MLTAFGKNIRKIRIDNNEILMDMATKLSTTPAYLSAVETGKRNVPMEWPKQIAKLYQKDSDELSRLAEESQKAIKINLTDYEDEDKRLVVSFAREFKSLTSEKKAQIEKALFSK